MSGKSENMAEIAIKYLDKINDVETSVYRIMVSDNTESACAAECLNLNNHNIDSLRDCIEKMQEEMNSIYIYAAALEKENADLKAHLNGR